MSKFPLNPFNLLPVICHVQYYEKKRTIIFGLERLPFFFKILCFQQPHRCYRNDLITSTVLEKLQFGPLQSVF